MYHPRIHLHTNFGRIPTNGVEVMRKNLKKILLPPTAHFPPTHPQRVDRILPKASQHIYITYPNELPNLVWIGQTVFAELETKAVILFGPISRIFKNSKKRFFADFFKTALRISVFFYQYT